MAKESTIYREIKGIVDINKLSDSILLFGNGGIHCDGERIIPNNTEISTLIAARVFEHLERDMFRNRPTKEDIHRLMAKELEITEAAIKGALYKDMPSKPVIKDFKYNDIWSKDNRLEELIKQWKNGFYVSASKNACFLLDYLKGKLRNFVQYQLQDNTTGPVYLSFLFKSNEGDNLFNGLMGFKSYSSELFDKYLKSYSRLSDELRESFVKGWEAAFGSKGKIAKAYLVKLEECCKYYESYMLYYTITIILDLLIERVDAYYKQILKPLSDTLVALPPLFEENVREIRFHEENGDPETKDCLIPALAFEEARKREFDEAVLKSEKIFLSSMYSNIKKLIGRNIGQVDDYKSSELVILFMAYSSYLPLIAHGDDEEALKRANDVLSDLKGKTIVQVDDDISSGIDVAGFISMFISENFSDLLTMYYEYGRDHGFQPHVEVDPG